jgi:DNA repair protein RecO (recombination protein O)
VGGGQFKVEGVVLRRRPLGEADDIVTFLSPTRGRFDAVARGLRKSKRSSAGRLEPFNQVSLLVAAGRSLDVIAQTQILRARPGLVADLDRLARGLYVLELFDRIAEGDAAVAAEGGGSDGARVFRCLVRALDDLEAVDPDLAARRAELRLLTVLGCAPVIDRCVRCGEDEVGAFSVEAGGLLCPSCRGQESGSRRLSRASRAMLLALRAPTLDDARAAWEAFDGGVRREVEAVLAAWLDWHCPARMRSRRFLDALRRSSA